VAFLVENGTGLPTATSYASVAAFAAYHLDRGHDFSAAASADVQRALVRATDYLDGRFQFVGTKRSSTQALQWPRSVRIVDPDGFAYADLPAPVVRAAIIYAKEAYYSSLDPAGSSAAPSVAPGAASAVALAPGPVRRMRDRLGPVENEAEYAVAGRVVSVFRPIPEADRLLRSLVVRNQEVHRG